MSPNAAQAGSLDDSNLSVDESASDACAEGSSSDVEACPTVLIDDAPSPTDELAHDGGVGPHSRVADAIANLVRSSLSSGSGGNNDRAARIAGRMIGIEGGWGVGKTTVIDLLRKEFECDELTTLFVFDAWAHRGDPLRRTFLESVVADLRSADWITDAQYLDEQKGWKVKMDALAKRRRVSTTTTVPKTTRLGTWFAISALLVPVGAAIVAGTISQATIDWTLPIHWESVAVIALGTLLAFAPLLLAIGYLAHERYHERTPTWELFSGEATAVQETVETDTPDPTSLEFESHFDQLMDDVLVSDPNRRLVLVLDNLDRVEVDDALAIWSTLQTFLQFTGRRDRQWNDRLWVVVPYDPGGLRALWEGKAEDVEKSEQREEQHTDSEDEDAGTTETKDKHPKLSVSRSKNVAESFLDKSFQIRFELPPPVHSNWRSYLCRLIRKALPRHERDVDLLCRLCSLAHPNQHPTPRELKIFVNQIGMVHRQWPCGTFPLSHIAYYVLLKRWNANVLDAVVTLPHPGLDAQLPKEPQPLKESLAGLAFNIEPKLGMEIVVKDRMLNAILSGEPERLEKLMHEHPPGFWPRIEDIASHELTDLAPTELQDAIQCCVSCKGLVDDHRSASVFRILGERATSPDLVWPRFDADAGAALAKLAGPLDDVGSTKKIAESLRRMGDSAKQQEAGISEGWLDGLSAFIDGVLAISHGDAVADPFPVNCTADQWIDAIPEIIAANTSADKPIWTYLAPNADPTELVAKISEAVSDTSKIQDWTSANRHIVDTVRVSHESHVELDWAPLLKSCRKRLDQGQNVSGREADELLRVLLFFHKAGQQEPLSNVVAGGHVYHCLSQKATKKDVDCRIRCLVATMMVTPAIAKPESMPGNAEQGYSYLMDELLASEDDKDARCLLDVIFSEIRPSVLFDCVSERDRWDALFVSALQILADDPERSLEIPTQFIIDDWPNIRDEINGEGTERFSGLIRRLIAEGSLVDDIQEHEFEAPLAGLYAEVIETANGGPLLEWVVVGVQQIPKKDWAEAIRFQNSTLDLVVTLRSAGATVNMPHVYRDVLVEFAGSSMKGLEESVRTRLAENKFDLVGLMQDDGQMADFRTRCASSLIHHQGAIAADFFDVFGQQMLEPDNFRGDQSVSVLFQGLVTSRNVSGLRWLQQLLSKDPTLIDTASTQIAALFRDRIREHFAEDHDDDARQSLSEIAKTLGIDSPSNNDNVSSTDDETTDDAKSQ